MQYMTMAQEFLKEYHPGLHERLRNNRKLRPAVNAYAAELKRKHNAWTNALRPTELVSYLSQLSGTALELALEDVQAGLRQEFGAEESEPLSIEQAFAFIRRQLSS